MAGVWLNGIGQHIIRTCIYLDDCAVFRVYGTQIWTPTSNSSMCSCQGCSFLHKFGIDFEQGQAG